MGMIETVLPVYEFKRLVKIKFSGSVSTLYNMIFILKNVCHALINPPAPITK